ncbi:MULTISPECIES: HEPN domain-containing protein [Metallosphaera]|uniref:HEPN domain-containing protein n=1 Tax=Metallosphaera TaxID=41980 RepID=UPI001EE15065|nr:HEPN domain-containing protein [Metallosphaera javensis (ex Hofmann et al. 2022)]
MLDWSEYERWMRASVSTLRSAEKDSDFNWACFKAEQAAQLSVKAYLILIGKQYFGHDLPSLLKRTGLDISGPMMDCALFLARIYIPSRYPDVLPEEAIPQESYSESDKQKAIECASKIIDMVKVAGEDLRRKEKAEGSGSSSG